MSCKGETDIMYEEQFFENLTKLRLAKGVSARDMSLSLGLSESYINRIESRKMLPSLTVFFYICEYFDITPGEFFSVNMDFSLDILEAVKKLSSFSEEKLKHILAVINDL